ncbi:MAG: ferritin-like domain-containing protein [Cyanobacteria bacterium P01_D01_bin.6]
MLEKINVLIPQEHFDSAPEPQKPNHYSDPEELVWVLREHLIPLELTLSLEYLYAYFSLRHSEEVVADVAQFPTLSQDLNFVRRTLLMISVGEMTHYRWAHQLLWLLQAEGLAQPTESQGIKLSRKIPRPDELGAPDQGFRRPALRPLTPDVLADFIAVERPSGYIDGAYAKLVATLKQSEYPQHLYELAAKIDADGMDHYSKLIEAQRILEPYSQSAAIAAYLRPLQVGTPEETRDALDHYREILLGVQQTYASISQGEFRAAGETVSCARDQMTFLQEEGEKLARQGIGVPFFSDAIEFLHRGLY